MDRHGSGVNVIIEEHGFTQAIQDVDVFAFSDDTIPDPLAPAVIPHPGEDRHIDVSIPFRVGPESNAVPVCAECDDREPAEARICLHLDPALAGDLLLGPAGGKGVLGLEWKSKQVDITIHDGEDLTRVDLELLPPPGIARNLLVQHHADLIDRTVIGKDDIGHFDVDETFACSV